jgi:hypothetical protein
MLSEKIDNAVTFYDNQMGLEITYDEFQRLKSIERQILINKLWEKRDKNPYALTFQEIKLLKTHRRKKTDKNGASHPDDSVGEKTHKIMRKEGTFYVAKKHKGNELERMQLSTIGFMTLVSSIMNKSGVLTYSNNVPIPSMEALKKNFNIKSNRVWGVVKNEIEKLDLIRSFKNREKNVKPVLIVNPSYSYTSRWQAFLRNHLVKIASIK